jgi:hypothetical protein
MYNRRIRSKRGICSALLRSRMARCGAGHGAGDDRRVVVDAFEIDLIRTGQRAVAREAEISALNVDG